MITWDEEVRLTGNVRTVERRRWLRRPVLVEQVEVEVDRYVTNPVDVDIDRALAWRDRRPGEVLPAKAAIRPRAGSVAEMQRDRLREAAVKVLGATDSAEALERALDELEAVVAGHAVPGQASAGRLRRSGVNAPFTTPAASPCPPRRPWGLMAA